MQSIGRFSSNEGKVNKVICLTDWKMTDLKPITNKVSEISSIIALISYSLLTSETNSN